MTTPVTTSSCWSNSETPVDSSRSRLIAAAAVPKTSGPEYHLMAVVRQFDVAWSPPTVRRHRRTDCRPSEEWWLLPLRPSRWSSPGASRSRYQPKSFFTQVAGGAAAICGGGATLRRSTREVIFTADNRRGAAVRATPITAMHFLFTYAQRSNDALMDRQVFIGSGIVENSAQTDLRTICRHCAYSRYDRSGCRPRVTPANTTAAAEGRGPR